MKINRNDNLSPWEIVLLSQKEVVPTARSESEDFIQQMISRVFFMMLVFISVACSLEKQDLKAVDYWHNQTRELRYQPDGKGFLIENGTHRFNRALYGSNTGFRVEAGDLPEFALYMPRVGGTFRLGMISGDASIWLIDAETIKARYEAGTMTYKIEDPMLKGGSLHLQLLALDDADGMILKASGREVPKDIELFWAFGGANGKRFSRGGDLGADPESVFYLTPDKCIDNAFFISENAFNLYYDSGREIPEGNADDDLYKLTPEEKSTKELRNNKRIFGLFPQNSDVKLSDANAQDTPRECYNSEKKDAPVIAGKIALSTNEDNYFFLLNPDTKLRPEYEELPAIFNKADEARKKLASRIKVETPDVYINAVGATLATAADAVWDGQSFMHGAIAWRMPLNGWRGAYAADWLGWHDRAKTHFRGYYKAQYTEPASGPSVPDPKTHLARQKEEMGTSMFTSGYISRRPGKINKPHHYDMNLVFIAQVLSHFNWTGDVDFLKESWPVIERHLEWEKRNFDPDDDGLYNAYCCIWASDALQYRGGGVTHSSAYNYRANKIVAELAPLLGKDPKPYTAEAEKIKKAVNKELWLENKGWFAEYKDLLGNQLVHPGAAIWTVYHAIDEGLADPFQAWQATNYVDQYIPKIPIEAEGLESGKYYTISTTNWMPYTWSINNVALAEVMHTALAYWQAGKPDKAFELTKSSFLDYMFLGSSPGNFGQLSYYDAFRGELYRDFADPTGMSARALIEGLFGVQPDLMNGKLKIEPGWPQHWDHALLETPDVKIDYAKDGAIDNYVISHNFPKEVQLILDLKASFDKVKSVTVNGENAAYSLLNDAIGSPAIRIETPVGQHFDIAISWGETSIETPGLKGVYAMGSSLNLKADKYKVLDFKDPQNILKRIERSEDGVTIEFEGEKGWRTCFVKLKQGEMTWWQDLTFELKDPVSLIYHEDQPTDHIAFSLRNNTDDVFEGKIERGAYVKNIKIGSNTKSGVIKIPAEHLVPGTNAIHLKSDNIEETLNVINWHLVSNNTVKFETLDILPHFNERVSNIFNEQYLSPRSPYPTLSIPIQGIGDWCSYRETEEIEDEGLREVASENGMIQSPQGIPFAISAEAEHNILFTSKWDNYPDSAEFELSGKASHIYLLMAGSAHHMQMNMVNGRVRVKYTDGSGDILPLKSPENWWPIEQDYYEDGYAFEVYAPRPPRMYLKSGEWHMDTYDVLKKNGTNRIEGGAASMLDLPLNPKKELKSLQLMTNTTDVVIGLMAVTLQRGE